MAKVSNNKLVTAKGGKGEATLTLPNYIKDLVLDMSDTAETRVSFENIVML